MIKEDLEDLPITVYCYSYDMIGKEANRGYKIIIFYQKYGFDATLEAFGISKNLSIIVNPYSRRITIK